jgi:hypothetical protein
MICKRLFEGRFGDRRSCRAYLHTPRPGRTGRSGTAVILKRRTYFAEPKTDHLVVMS